ncbi:hypothetical protein [Paraburkholderia flagellata]|uniref:hypothetical protein n=1 Tax=Paraburkholderia flagellata TaxID=2883241 RepID=UPI003571256C
MTLARAIERLRIERSCNLIESRRISIKAVSVQRGFSSEEVMRRSFMRSLYVGPADYRKRFFAFQT